MMKPASLWAEYLDENEDLAVATELCFEYSRDAFGHYQVLMVSGFEYNQEEAQEMVLDYLKVNHAEFEYL
jgi:hypothetical protein